jgi:hypothetical protein
MGLDPDNFAPEDATPAQIQGWIEDTQRRLDANALAEQ